MNKKQQSSNKRRKRASIGLSVCFAAAIVLTGAYTWRNYRANVKDEQAKIEEEQQAKEEEIKRNTEETSSIAKKALEDEEPVTKEDSQAANTAADGSTENRMDTWETDSTQTAGTAMNLNFGEDSQLLWPVDGNVLMSYSMDKTVYFSTLDQYRYNPVFQLPWNPMVSQACASGSSWTAFFCPDSHESGKSFSGALLCTVPADQPDLSSGLYFL